MVRPTDVDETTGTVQLEGGHVPRPRATGLARGTTIDRYTVLELVGSGGMGDVYAAYDPKLDRKIALKLITDRRLHRGPAADARLLREAQAIAKVSHPNVVTVHDTGTFGDRVFIAMEFVDGPTLKEWLTQRPRARSEILALFKSAARGLAAAHAAGLVHRDFKPQNVMVGRDGDARVMDFGLVRWVDAGPGNDDSGHPPLGERQADVDLTATGDLLGTPNYMAPEQIRAEDADPRTDQFSFCVALYEALYGQRPFGGATVPELFRNVTEGRVAPPPPKAGVPGWLRRIVLRGLEVERARRFPSMDALRAALDTDPTRRGRRVALGFGLLVVLALVALGARRAADAKHALCQGGNARWAGVWEPGGAPSGRKAAIHRAFAATGKAYAETAFTEVSRLLDGYAARWLAMYADACEATHLRGEQSTEVLDLRMACLGERLTSTSALVDVFRTADETVVENAVQAAGTLPALDRCANVTLLKALVRPPDSEALRKQVDALAAEVSGFVAASVAGRCAEAERGFQAMLPRVRATGYLPLVAKTLYEAGFLAAECTDTSQGLGLLREAYTTALASRHDEVAAHAAVVLARLLANRVSNASEGRHWLHVCDALLQRFDDHPLLDRWRMGAEVVVLTAEGRTDEAIAAARRDVENRRRTQGPDHFESVVATNDLGIALEAAGRYDEALVATSEALRIARRVLGDDHPQVAVSFYNEGEILNFMGRHAEARGAVEQALNRWRRTSAHSTYVAYGLNGLGIAALGEGRPDEAVPLLEEALRSRIANQASPPDLAETRFALARALWSRPATRARAATLATQARADVADAKALLAARLRVQIDAWLAKRGAALARK